MKNISAKELKEYAKQLRKTAVTMIYEAQSGHPGGSLSIADIVACLYFREMNVDPKNPRWADRDRFVLSKGHVCPIQYSALGLLGFFPEVEKLFISQILDLDVEGRFISGRKTSGHKILLVSVRGRKASGLYPDDVDCLYFTVKL